MNKQDKKYSLKEINDLWVRWSEQPFTTFRRKVTPLKSKVAGGPPTMLPGIGEIIFIQDFPGFIAQLEEKPNQVTAKTKEEKLKKTFFPKDKS